MAMLMVELPDQLREQLRAFVAQGWYSSESELVQEALRRFLEARDPKLAARFVKEDVDWGLMEEEQACRLRSWPMRRPIPSPFGVMRFRTPRDPYVKRLEKP